MLLDDVVEEGPHTLVKISSNEKLEIEGEWEKGRTWLLSIWQILHMDRLWQLWITNKLCLEIT